MAKEEKKVEKQELNKEELEQAAGGQSHTQCPYLKCPEKVDFKGEQCEAFLFL